MTGSRPAGAQFGIDIDADAARTTLWLYGELDALSVPVFASVLTTLADQGARRVTIDLTHLRFCNIGGLRAMAELAARLNDVDGSVEIVAPSLLMRMLELSDLRSLFVIRDLEDPDPFGEQVIDLVAAERTPASSRLRAGSLHRLSSGT